MRVQSAATLIRGALRAATSDAGSKLSNNCSAASFLIARRGFADDANLKKTALYDYHVAQGGEWVRAPDMGVSQAMASPLPHAAKLAYKYSFEFNILLRMRHSVERCAGGWATVAGLAEAGALCVLESSCCLCSAQHLL